MQAAFAIDTSRDTISTVAAMKSAVVQLSVETKKIDMAELEVGSYKEREVDLCGRLSTNKLLVGCLCDAGCAR